MGTSLEGLQVSWAYGYLMSGDMKVFLCFCACFLLFGLSNLLCPRYDLIVRRTRGGAPVGSAMRLADGTWYRVVMVRPYAAFPEQPVHGPFWDLFLRRLRDDEAAVHEVMNG